MVTAPVSDEYVRVFCVNTKAALFGLLEKKKSKNFFRIKFKIFFIGGMKMIEWKDITTATLIPGRAYEVKVIDTIFDNICLYVDGGCFIFYDATKPGSLGCVERKVVFSDAVPSSMVALALPIGDYKVSDSTEFPLPIPCQIMKIYSDIEPGCVIIKEFE